MGNQKQKWKAEEEEALRAGVAKHGTGKWKNILRDPEFAPFLTLRSNIDLKDKWRNLNVGTATQGSKEKSVKSPKIKAITDGPFSGTPNSLPIVLVSQDASCNAFIDNHSKNKSAGENAPRYSSTAMIIEAISTLKDPNGCNISAIYRFIEQSNEVPQNFRRFLSSKLRRLVLQGKLEKVEKGYKIKKDSLSGTKTPSPLQKDIRSRLLQHSGSMASVDETLEEAAASAAYKIADAENKSFVAAEAVKEAERVTKMAEDVDLLLQLVEEIYDQCSRVDKK